MSEDSSRSNYKELIKNTSLLAVGNFSSKILVFLMVPLYTNTVSTSNYGFYDLVISTVQLLLPFFSLNVIDGVLRFLIENRDNEKQILRISVKYLLISVIPAFLILFSNLLFGYSDELSKYMVYVLLYYISYMFNQLFIQYSKGVDMVKVMTIAGVLGTVCNVIPCFIMLMVFKMGIKAVFISSILGQLIPAFYMILKLNLVNTYRLARKGPIDKGLQKMLLKYSLPLIMTTFGWWLNNTSDKYIITYLSGIELNGLLAVAYKIPSIITVLCSFFIQAWQISAMKEYGKDDSGYFYDKTFCYFNLFMYFSASLLIILTRLIAVFAFAKDFYQAWTFVPYLVMSAVFTASAGYIAPILTSSYNTVAVAKSAIIGGIINILLNIFLIWTIGDIGVALATAVSSFIIMFLRYIALKGEIKKITFVKICILYVILFIQATLEVKEISYMQLIAVLIVAIMYKSDIKKILNVIISSMKGRRQK